jgi:SAM-dependent methyltransferase
MNTDHYRTHAQSYFDATVHLDMSWVRARFLGHLKAGDRILDAGCGSGRDARAFLDAGHPVIAFDGSPEMVRLATEHVGQPVFALDFHEIDQLALVGIPLAFEGIWACSSLVHLNEAELTDTLAALANSLKPSGAFFFCLKHGDPQQSGVEASTGRHFNRHTLQTVSPIARAAGLDVVDHWRSESQRQPGVEWCNVVCRKA